MRSVILAAALAAGCGDGQPPPPAGPPAPEAARPSLVERLAALSRCYVRGRARVWPCFEPRRVVEVDEERRTAVARELRPPDPVALAALARAWRPQPVPDDLRGVLSRFDGGTLSGGGTSLILIGPADALDHVDDPVLEELPGYRIFGTDGGGSLYAYGEGGVHLVRMGAPDTHFVVGRSLEEVAAHVMRGADLYELYDRH